MRLLLVLCDFAESTDVLALGSGLAGLCVALVARGDLATMLRCAGCAATGAVALSVLARVALRVGLALAARRQRVAVVVRGRAARQDQADSHEDLAERLDVTNVEG